MLFRSIVTEPSVLFADEPTGNLDTARSVEIMDLLVGFNRARGLTVVMVTHEADMAAYASRTIRFRDGHVESDERARSVRPPSTIGFGETDRDAGVH